MTCVLLVEFTVNAPLRYQNQPKSCHNVETYTCTFSAENYLYLIIKTENVQRPGNNFEYIQISSLLQNKP